MGQEAGRGGQVVLIELELAGLLALALLVEHVIEDGLVFWQEVLKVAVMRIVVKDVSLRCRRLLLFFAIDMSSSGQLTKVIDVP